MQIINKKKTKKITRKPKEEFTTFAVEVIDWELPYSFSLNHNDKYFPGPYSEHLHLQVKGVIREPKIHDGKVIELTFIGDRSIVPDINNRSSVIKPNRVGTINMRGEYRRFIGSIPFDSLQIIAPMLESKRLRYIELHGSSLFEVKQQHDRFAFLRIMTRRSGNRQIRTINHMSIRPPNIQ